jgi:hypothetical protein
MLVTGYGYRRNKPLNNHPIDRSNGAIFSPAIIEIIPLQSNI